MELKEKHLQDLLKKENYLKFLILFFMISSIGIYAQEINCQNTKNENCEEATNRQNTAFIPQAFTVRKKEALRGDVLMIGNTILGLISNPEGPNGTFDGDDYNGGGITKSTGYIDIDGDNTTFSSSSANLANPNSINPGCVEIVYAGLYWAASYYLARNNTTPVLTINNSSIAYPYIGVKKGNFGSTDLSNIQTSPASSNLVIAQPLDGCLDFTNKTEILGNIAVIRHSVGSPCSIKTKVINAEKAGAVGVVIVGSTATAPDLVTVAGDPSTQINIPSISIGNNIIRRKISGITTTGLDLITELTNQTNVVNATLSTTGNELLTGLPTLDVRSSGVADYKNIKLGYGSPGSVNYVSVTPQSGTEVIDGVTTHEGVIYDGYSNTATNPNTTADLGVNYVCYANVTDFIKANRFGTYTVANAKATLGETSGAAGANGGWSLVVIYKDPTPSATNTQRFISVFDGYQVIQARGTDVDFSISGFNTLPRPLPVKVKFGVSALEGDNVFYGDNLQIKGTNGLYQSLFDGINPKNNFFNSTISSNGAITTNRNPASKNTLGYDADIFNLKNSSKQLIGNEQSSADFRLTTIGDTYAPFMSIFSVEEIVPKLRVLKEVYDPADLTTNIKDGDVVLGGELVYKLKIKNVGNENLTGNVTIEDKLPNNVNLMSIENNAVNPSGTIHQGIQYTTTGIGGSNPKITFTIPPSEVELVDGEIEIQFRVKITENCSTMLNACSNAIENQTISTYTGILTNSPGSGDDIYSGDDISSCGNIVNAKTKVFIKSIGPCEQDVSFCGGTLVLTAGTGFDKYTWTDPNGNITTTTSNTQNFSNATAGFYSVVKEDNSPVNPCLSLEEIFKVTDFSIIQHPLKDDAQTDDTVEYFGPIAGNSNPLVIINLCGDQIYNVNSNFDPGSLISITWQKLTGPISCFSPNDTSPSSDSSCIWEEITPAPPALTTALDFDKAGEYRMNIEFKGGCVRNFYFDIKKNDYQPTFEVTEMKCNNPGKIKINNIPAGSNYLFMIRDYPDPTPPTVTSTFPNTTGEFNIPFQFPQKDFIIYAIDSNFKNCVYDTGLITVPSYDPTYTIKPEDPKCPNNIFLNGKGSIFVEVVGGKERILVSNNRFKH